MTKAKEKRKERSKSKGAGGLSPANSTDLVNYGFFVASFKNRRVNHLKRKRRCTPTPRLLQYCFFELPVIDVFEFWIASLLNLIFQG